MCIRDRYVYPPTTPTEKQHKTVINVKLRLLGSKIFKPKRPRFFVRFVQRWREKTSCGKRVLSSAWDASQCVPPPRRAQSVTSLSQLHCSDHPRSFSSCLQVPQRRRPRDMEQRRTLRPLACTTRSVVRVNNRSTTPHHWLCQESAFSWELSLRSPSFSFFYFPSPLFSLIQLKSFDSVVQDSFDTHTFVDLTTLAVLFLQFCSFSCRWG